MATATDSGAAAQARSRWRRGDRRLRRVLEQHRDRRACRRRSLPIYGDTTTNASRTTVADARRRQRRPAFPTTPSACRTPTRAAPTRASSTCSSGAPARSARRPPRSNVASASFTITGHGGELLGFAVSGGDFNGDGRADIGIGAPMGAGPNRVGAGVVYFVFGSANPRNLSTTELNYTGYTNAPTNPAPHSPLGSRYEGFQPNSHTGTSVAALPDVNGDGLRRARDWHAPTPTCTCPGGGGAAVLYGTRQGEHINLADLWEAGYPYCFHVDLPGTLDQQHVGETVASVRRHDRRRLAGHRDRRTAVGLQRAPTRARCGSSAGACRRPRAAGGTGCRSTRPAPGSASRC